MEKIIDVSSYQGNIDWKKVKNAGIGFAVLRAIVKSGKADVRFGENVRGCREAGVGFDVYKYCYARTVEASREEARKVVKLLREHGCGSEVTVWWDMEDASQRKLNRKLLTAIVKAAEEEIGTAGYTFGIYCNRDWYLNVLDNKAFACPFWVARYPSSKEMRIQDAADARYKPRFVQNLWGWQYTSSGKIPGIAGRVDLSELYV